MINKPTKIEIYIIVVTLVLSVVTVGGFWLVNNYNFSSLTVSILSLSGKDDPAITKDSSDIGGSEGYSDDPSENQASDPAERQAGNQADATANKEEPNPNPEKPVEPVSTRTGLAKLLDPVELNAVILGDSVAQSLGASNPEETSWHSNVARDLHVTYPGTIKWNFITGVDYTIDDISSEVASFPIKSDVFIICAGRSDSSFLGPAEFRNKYQELITGLKTSTPDADIVLFVEPPVQDVNVNSKYFPYRQVILDLGANHDLPVIDGWQMFINDPNPLASLLADGVHPNDAGYRLLADALVNRIEEDLVEEN